MDIPRDKTVGLTVGRYQPFHKGHLKSLNWILERVTKLYIVIGSAQESRTKKNPFTCLERKKMIESCLTGNIIFLFSDDNESDDIWKDNILKQAQDTDIIFTNNDVVKNIFNGTIEIIEVPFFYEVRATEIRKLMREKKRWEHLVPESVINIIGEINMDKFVNVGVSVLLTGEKGIILGRRNKNHSHGVNTWCSPGGHIEYGETPEETVAREAMEEVNVKVKNIKFIGITNDIFKKEGKHYITLWYSAEYESGKISSSSELAYVGWYPLDKLPGPLFLCMKNFLDKYKFKYSIL